jgi:NitT/TauT family transport system permease protein
VNPAPGHSPTVGRKDRDGEELSPALSKQSARPPASPGKARICFKSLGYSRLAKGLLALLLPVAAVTIWQLAGAGGSIAGGALPTPDRVWNAWVVWAFGTPGPMTLSAYTGNWLDAVSFSAARVAKGFALAILAGVPIGIMIGWWKLASAMVDPTIQWLRPVPITSWLPISIALFGISDFGSVFLITIGAFYPIAINATQGARGIDKNWIRAASMMGAGQASIMRRVVLPAALPSIFTGLRLGLGIAWTAVIVSEMVAVKSGLGYVLWDAYYVGRMDIVIADMVSIGLLGFLSDWTIVRLELWALRWRRLQSFNQS